MTFNTLGKLKELHSSEPLNADTKEFTKIANKLIKSNASLLDESKNNSIEVNSMLTAIFSGISQLDGVHFIDSESQKNELLKTLVSL